MNNRLLCSATFLSSLCLVHSALSFEGRITATLKRGGRTQTFLYTVGAGHLRIERGETNRPYTKDLVDLRTGAITLLFPNNRTFVRLKTGEAYAPSRVPADASSGGAGREARPTALGAGAPPTPGVPPGSGARAGVASGSRMTMPAMPMAPLELKATDQTTNLLGYPCKRYTLKQRGEVMEIWATDQLLPFQPYLRNQPRHFGPRWIEEQWQELVKSKRLFPLLAILKFEHGGERLRFEVKFVRPKKPADNDAALFKPPPDYHEIPPLPF